MQPESRPPAADTTVDAGVVVALEKALIKKNYPIAAKQAAKLPGLLGTLAAVEAAIKQAETDSAEFHQQAGMVDAAIPGLCEAITRAIGDRKQSGALQQQVTAAAPGLDPAMANFLWGLVLEVLVTHNHAAEAVELSVGANDAIDHARGLRWSYFAAKALLAANEPARALPVVDGVLERFPEALPTILHLRGLILRQMGQRHEAAQEMLRSIALDPHYPPPITALHFIVWNRVAVEESLQVIEKIVGVRPCNVQLKALLADLYSLTGRIEKAKPLYLEFIRAKVVEKRPRLGLLEWPEKPAEKPGFIIIGAPKCGTTSAYAYMSNHPKILPASIKEVSFFSEKGRYELGIDWYLAQFPSLAGTNGFISGEASPGYFYSDTARERITSHFPDTRLILFLRNPADRAISNYYQQVKMGHKLQPLDVYIRRQIEALRKNDCRFDLKTAGVVARGIYHRFVAQWQTSLDRNALLIINAEEFFEDPAPVMRQIYEHVGVEPIERKNFAVANKGLYPQTPDDLMQELRAFYAPHNQQLYATVGRDFQW